MNNSVSNRIKKLFEKFQKKSFKNLSPAQDSATAAVRAELDAAQDALRAHAAVLAAEVASQVATKVADEASKTSPQLDAYEGWWAEERGRIEEYAKNIKKFVKETIESEMGFHKSNFSKELIKNLDIEFERT